jgi:hypothetical protein
MDNVINLPLGSQVTLEKEAKFSNGKKINEQLFNEKLYIISSDESTYTLSRKMKGASLGKVNKSSVVLHSEDEKAMIQPYTVQIMEDNIPLFIAADKNSAVLNHLGKYGLYVIINEQKGFGKIEKGAGWIDLSQVKVLR